MFLKVKGIGKIQDSTIEMKGITVIAGENNTGKSTFGKVLYCMFNAFHNVDERVHKAQVSDIRRIFRGELPRFRDQFLGQNIINDILSGTISIGDGINGVIKAYSSINPIPDPDAARLLFKNLDRSISIDKHEIQRTIVTRCFRYEFAGKINHFNRPDTQGNISLEIKEKKIEVTIKSDECDFFADDVGLLHNTVYIDTPFIMDDVDNHFKGEFGFYNTIGHRDDLLERLIKKDSNNTVLEEVIFKQKINNILSSINSVVRGEFTEEDSNLMFAEQGLIKPVPLSSVSTGIKMFLIIKRLLELGEIRERDVLIFDEPEIHLHPEWQINFAEILVLLQQEFDLTVLLTTHSPYFLHAIEVYSDKYSIKDKLNCYLAELEGDASIVRDVTENIDEIYQQLAQPFQKLEDIQYDE